MDNFSGVLGHGRGVGSFCGRFVGVTWGVAFDVTVLFHIWCGIVGIGVGGEDYCL